MRRIQWLGRVGMALWAVACAGSLAEGQIRGGPSVKLVVDPERDVLQALSEARQKIEQKQYHAAAQLLQFVLERPEDNFLEQDFLEERGQNGGLRKEVLRQLMEMPAEGQAAYELDYGATARQMLEAAAAADNLSGVAEVARRFLATAAGYEAVTLLAAYAADGNRPLEAALLLESVRNHPRRTPRLSLQRAVSWSRAGRLGRALSALRELKRVDPMGTLRIAGKEIPLPTDDDQATRLLKSLALRDAGAAPAVPMWLMPGGNPARNASAAPASPVGGNIWRVSTLQHLTVDGRPEEDQRQRTRFQETLERVVLSLAEDNRPAVPAAQPLVVGETVVYRTPGDVTAVNVQTGELLWRSSVVDESLIRFLNTRGADARLRPPRGLSLHAATLEGHLERRVFRDMAAGSLTSDGQTVFALEELDGNTSVALNVFGAAESRPANKLVAYDLAGGLLLWEVGGPRGSKPVELSSLYFLGPPLPIDGRLYVIAEAQGALQLLALQQDSDRQSVRIDWSQSLIATDPPLTEHPLRRLSGIAPSASDGVLVCPTASGAVVAIDLARRALLWGFQYPSHVRPETQSAPVFEAVLNQEYRVEEADKAGRWMDSTPLIVDGKVLVTPRDSDRLYCLDLVDGHEIWQLARDEWIYVACVTDGRVVLVGRRGVGAVNLSDGTPLDSFAGVELEPTGRGVRIGTSYCLPTASGEIATIDLQSGLVLARSKLNGNLVPGNLAAGGGAIVSQSAGELIGFSRLASIEQQIARLAGTPQDAQSLALRGELRLHRGEEAAGLSDLRESLKRKPDPHVKLVLATALLAGVRAHPARVLDHVEELEAVTDDPQQRNEFLRLYSQALETRGDRVGAFTQMIRLADTAQFLDNLQPVESGYSLRTDRSIRARLIAMHAAATAEQQKEMDRALEQHIQATAATLDRDQHLGRSLQFFGGLPKAEAALLQSVTSASDVPGERRQELLRPFARSADAEVAAQATALRCRELIQFNQWQSAVPLIRQLRAEFADRECLDGKTGHELAEQWSTRDELRRLLTTPPVWPRGEIEPQRSDRDPTTQRMNVPVEIESRTGSLLAGWSFETDLAGTILMARDDDGVLRWKLPLPIDGDYNDAELRGIPVACQIHIRDNWLTMSRLSYFVVIDVAANPAPRIVWRQLLKPAGVSTADLMRQPMRGRAFGRTSRFTRPINPLGEVVGITHETVLYTLGTKLLGAELETGRLVWSRQDAKFSQIDATADDRVIAIIGRGGGLAGPEFLLLRTLDGAVVAKRPLPAAALLWARGARQLVRRPGDGISVIQLIDLERDVVVWSHECPLDSQVTVVDDEDVVFLEPDGQLQAVRLSDKRERYRSKLPLKLGNVEKGFLAVQRSTDRDIILAGESYKHRANQIVPFESANAQLTSAFDGFVCGVSRKDGTLQWTTPVEGAALDMTQPAGLPVLLLASRQQDGRNAGNPFLQRFRMKAEVIDKRTGQRVYSIDDQTGTATALAPRFEPDPERGRIVVNFHEWQLELKFVSPEGTPPN